MDRCRNRSRVADRPFAPRTSRRWVVRFSAAALPLFAAIALTCSSLAASTDYILELVYGTNAGRGGVLLANPMSVSQNARTGEFAVANTTRGRVEIMDPSGHAATFFEHRLRARDGAMMSGQPSTVCYDAQGNVLVADNLDPGVDVMTVTGRVVGRLTIPGGMTQGGQAFDSTAGAIALLRDGSILVATRGNPARLHLFSANGRWLRAWGQPGAAEGQLSRISGVAQAPSGEIVVLCTGTQFAAQRFDSTGAYLGGFGTHEMGEGNVSFPSGITITADGRIWICDELRQSVQVYTAQGRYLGLAVVGGGDAGSVLYPTSLATDGKTRLAVLDRVGGRLQVFRIPDSDSAFNAPGRR